jgi:hypothetical protein
MTDFMNRLALADRIVTYSDTVVAFALVNGFAFLITLAEPDIRCSIANVSSIVTGLNLLIPVVGTYALVWLRRYQKRLEQDEVAAADEAGEASSADPSVEDELVARFWRIAFVVRVTLIWVFGAIVILGIYGATQDERCAAILR